MFFECCCCSSNLRFLRSPPSASGPSSPFTAVNAGRGGKCSKSKRKPSLPLLLLPSPPSPPLPFEGKSRFSALTTPSINSSHSPAVLNPTSTQDPMSRLIKGGRGREGGSTSRVTSAPAFRSSVVSPSLPSFPSTNRRSSSEGTHPLLPSSLPSSLSSSSHLQTPQKTAA